MNDPSRSNQFSPPHPLIGMPDDDDKGGIVDYISPRKSERERECVYCVAVLSWERSDGKCVAWLPDGAALYELGCRICSIDITTRI